MRLNPAIVIFKAMKRLLTVIIVMTGFLFFACEDPADDLFQEVESGKSINGNPESEEVDAEEEAKAIKKVTRS